MICGDVVVVVVEATLFSLFGYIQINMYTFSYWVKPLMQAAEYDMTDVIRLHPEHSLNCPCFSFDVPKFSWNLSLSLYLPLKFVQSLLAKLPWAFTKPEQNTGTAWSYWPFGSICKHRATWVKIDSLSVSPGPSLKEFLRRGDTQNRQLSDNPLVVEVGWGWLRLVVELRLRDGHLTCIYHIVQVCIMAWMTVKPGGNDYIDLSWSGHPRKVDLVQCGQALVCQRFTFKLFEITYLLQHQGDIFCSWFIFSKCFNASTI